MGGWKRGVQRKESDPEDRERGKGGQREKGKEGE